MPHEAVWSGHGDRCHGGRIARDGDFPPPPPPEEDDMPEKKQPIERGGPICLSFIVLFIMIVVVGIAISLVYNFGAYLHLEIIDRCG